MKSIVLPSSFLRGVFLAICFGLCSLSLVAPASPGSSVPAGVPTLPELQPTTGLADSPTASRRLPSSARGSSTKPQHESYGETLEGTLISFEMVAVPAGSVTVFAPDAPGAGREVQITPFFIGKTEVTWDEYDVWMLGLDRERSQRRRIDAESRPSRPYGAPDRGFGHAGHAAISVTFHAAEQYARWLAEKTGRPYRLPTAAEWEHACRAGFDGREIDTEYLEATAWYGVNSSRSTHEVASKLPNALGIFDMLGNAGEWAANAEGEAALHGGSYRDDADAARCGARALQEPSWNSTDPQIPKSTWWLSDGPFAGFRVARDAAAGGEPATSTESGVDNALDDQPESDFARIPNSRRKP